MITLALNSVSLQLFVIMMYFLLELIQSNSINANAIQQLFKNWKKNYNKEKFVKF